jgi:hypothetical protein
MGLSSNHAKAKNIVCFREWEHHFRLSPATFHSFSLSVCVHCSELRASSSERLEALPSARKPAKIVTETKRSDVHPSPPLRTFQPRPLLRRKFGTPFLTPQPSFAHFHSVCVWHRSERQSFRVLGSTLKLAKIATEFFLHLNTQERPLGHKAQSSSLRPFS